MSNAPAVIDISELIALTLETKSAMQIEDREKAHSTWINDIKPRLKAIDESLKSAVDFLVYDTDLPIPAYDSKSYNCIWIGTVDDPLEDEDITEVTINPKTPSDLFYAILCHMLHEIVNEDGGFRRALYINYAYSMLVLRKLVKPDYGWK